MDHSIALITDSTCDIPDELLARHGINFLPASVTFGAETFRDRIDISAAEFYCRLANEPVLPTTAHPTPEHFRLAYETARSQGASEVVVVTVSSAMSGTYAAASLAAGMVGFPVHVVDSKGPTMSTGWQVLAAARAREAGGDAQAMLAAADRARQTMTQWVSLDTLEYLHKGGRIGHATRFIGSLLNIKPLVYIDHQTGLVEPGQPSRTRRRALDALYQGFFAQLGTAPAGAVQSGVGRRLRVAVLHGGALEEAEAMAERIRREYHPVELIVTVTSPVLGVHTGPRAIALCGYVDG